MTRLILILSLLPTCITWGQYAPAANVAGTTAISKDSSAIVNWASEVHLFERGFENIANGLAYASFGTEDEALGYAEGNSTDVVSLGDSGVIVLSFQYPIENGAGPDFAVFENGFGHDYLELAHVEVSTDGINFVRFPSKSTTQTSTQIGTFGTSSAEYTNNLAGKYIQGYGTPFDLNELSDSSQLNLDSINYVKIIDVVGSIDPAYGTYDSQGALINDPYPTEFEPGGFDLDGVAVLHENNIFASTIESHNALKIFPNPTKDLVYLQGYSGQVELYDLAGKKLKEMHIEQGQSISLGGYQSGIYLLKVGGELIKISKL
ncbi:MAG: T9SS type A sorting domain-containing protein [Crocinitomicaceae bacterium]